MSVLVKISSQATNTRLVSAIRHVPENYYMSYVHISHVYILVLIDTRVCMLKTFVTCL